MLGDESDLEVPDDQFYRRPPGSSLNSGAPPASRDWTSPQAWAGLDPALIYAYGLLDPLDVPKPVPGLLGSLDDLRAATGQSLQNSPVGRTGLPNDPQIGQIATDHQGVRQYFIGYDHGGNQVWNPTGVTSNGPDDPNVTETDPLVVRGHGHGHESIGAAIGDTLGKSWGTINTLAGLGLGGIEYGAGLLTGTHPSVGIGNNAVQFTGVPNLLHALFPNSFDEHDVATLGNVQIYTGEATPITPGENYVRDLPSIPLGRHEEAHTYQSQVLGPLYGPLWWALGGRSPNNPLERAADWYGAGEGGPFSHVWSAPPQSQPHNSR